MKFNQRFLSLVMRIGKALSKSIVSAYVIMSLITPAAAQHMYDKTFFATGVKVGSQIFAGGEAKTWAGASSKKDKVPFEGDNRIYEHCITNTNQGFLMTYGGFPAGPNFFGGDIKAADPAKPAVTQSDSDMTGVITDGDAAHGSHNAPNKADSAFTVGLFQAGPKKVISNGTPLMLKNYVQVDLVGHTTAGTPNQTTDKDLCHSASSFVAVEIEDVVDQYHVTMPGAVPVVMAVGKNALSGPSFDQDMFGKVVKGKPQLNHSGSNTDPYFVTVTNHTTGVVTQQIVMEQTLLFHDADYLVDDSGIHLSIAKGDPLAFVSLDFTSAFAWVQNPYVYGAALTSSGLSAYGLTPLSGWTITNTANTIEAFYAYGLDGQPFDSALVQPSASLFAPGDVISEAIGAGDGTSDLVTVPEPSSILILGSLLSSVSILLFRKLRLHKQIKAQD